MNNDRFLPELEFAPIFIELGRTLLQAPNLTDYIEEIEKDISSVKEAEAVYIGLEKDCINLCEAADEAKRYLSQVRLFLTDEEIDTRPHGQCIRCGWCLEACPMGLSPSEIAIYVEAGRAADTSQFGVFECFECGCCAFVCPAKRPLVQFIRLAKMKAKK